MDNTCYSCYLQETNDFKRKLEQLIREYHDATGLYVEHINISNHRVIGTLDGFLTVGDITALKYLEHSTQTWENGIHVREERFGY